MKKLIGIFGLTAIFLTTQLMAQEGTQTQAENKKADKVQNQHRVKSQQQAQTAAFVDEDGDGFNDNAQAANKAQARKGKRNTHKKGEKAFQSKAQKGFVDEDGDGFNDNALDSDGDGIPNGMDPDYEGAMARKGAHSKGFIDEDGDGINDNAMDSDGDGIPNGQDADYTRPADGSGAQQGQMNGGSGQNGSGTGECDTTGPKGKRGRR